MLYAASIVAMFIGLNFLLRAEIASFKAYSKGLTPLIIPGQTFATHTFYWEGELYYTDRENNRQFNFITSKGDWDKVYFLVPENGNSDSYREMVEDGGTYKMRRIKGPGNPLSASWGIEEKNNGMYRVEADLETMTVKVSKIK